MIALRITNFDNLKKIENFVTLFKVILETPIILLRRHDNKLCFLKKLDYLKNWAISPFWE